MSAPHFASASYLLGCLHLSGEDGMQWREDERSGEYAARPEVSTPAWLSRVGAWLGAQLLTERERWALWCPVAFGTGVGAYFTLPSEPPFWLGTAGVAFALLLAVAGRLRATVLVPALILALLAGGFAAAQLRTRVVAAPVLAEEIGGVDVVARVSAVEPRERGVRLRLRSPEISGLPPRRTPVEVRVAVVAGAPDIMPGDRVRLTAVLRPPPEPVAPGAFDFARHAYFQQLGAVGFALGRVDKLPGAPGGSVRQGWRSFWAETRHAAAERIRATLPGPSGALAAALMTGERGAIPEDIRQAMRDSGLAHLLAISGLHVGLVAGLVFFAVRGGLALIPPVALRWPIKKWAAAAAVLAAAGYLLLVGATVPTQRAFVMVGIVLLGVALDRRAVTMRLVAWAAMLVLVLHPESLTGASFQMSFAAATGLVACYEALRGRGLAPVSDRGLLLRAAAYFGGVALTSLVAVLATSPFAVYHFNRLALYGLAANMVAVPLVAFWVMPWALAAFLLLPLGLERLALVPMDWGLRLLLNVATGVADWPAAAVLLASPPQLGLVAIAAGGLWLCLWMRPWRLWGLAPIAGGAASLLLAPTPDVLIGRDAELLAVRDRAGNLVLSTDRRARFSANVWLRRDGQDRAATFPEAGAAASADLACDPWGCIYRRNGHVVALVRDGRALIEDCRAATVLVATLPVRRHDCPAPLVVIDRLDIWRDGGHALHLRADDVRVENVRAWRGARPWVRRRGAQ